MNMSKSNRIFSYVWAVIGTFLIIIAAYTAWDVYRDYRLKSDSFMRDSQSQVRIIAEHASRTIGEVDRAMDNVLRDMSTRGKPSTDSEKALYDIFVANRLNIPQISSFFFIDTKGTLKASSLQYPIEQIDLSSREYFKIHRDTPGDAPHLSRPYKNRTTGKWVFVFSQRISKPDGSFAGIIGASCNLEYFETLYSTLFNSSSRRISLVRDDGHLIVSSPVGDHYLEVNLKNGRMFTEYLPKSSIGSYRNLHTSDDKSDRLVAYARVPGTYPLIARISFEWSDLYSEWKRNVVVRVILTVFFGSVLLILTSILVSKLRLLETSNTKVLQLSRAVEQSPVSVVITDTAGAITYVNPKFSELTGYSLDEAVGQNPRILKSDITSPDTYVELWNTLQSGNAWRGEFFNKKKNGDGFWEMAYISPVINAQGETTHFVAVKEDISDRKLAENTLKEQSITDEQTGLNNRRGFILLANQQIKISTRSRNELILVYADLDRLKWINDTFGHNEGDRAIIDTANILRASFRVSDIIARIGGDEFVALSVDASEQSEERILERLHENLDAHHLDNERQYKLSISFGFTRHTPLDHCTLDELLHRADQQMYAQKTKKRMNIESDEA